MKVVAPSDAVLALIANATGRLVIAAPYIKSATLRQVIDAVPDVVSELSCITRWLPEDIVSGACDLEIFDDIMHVQGGRLLVHPHLHAKYYSNGREALIGSANLTSRGLGWYIPANVELLVSLPAEFPGLIDWESMLLDSAVEATAQLRDRIRMRVEQLRQAGPIQHAPEVENQAGDDRQATLWVPKCPVPERLWEVYSNHGADTMVSSAFRAAQNDLAALSPPQGLTKNLFIEYVAGILRYMPVIMEIDRLAATGLTDARASELLLNYLSDHIDNVDESDRSWRILKAWLSFFFPELYRLESGHEILIKGREIISR